MKITILMLMGVYWMGPTIVPNAEKNQTIENIDRGFQKLLYKVLKNKINVNRIKASEILTIINSYRFRNLS